MRKKYTNEQLDAIVADKLLFKLNTKETAEKHGFSRAFVDVTCATYRHVAAGNWDKIRFMLDGNQMQMKTVEWAAAKCGVTIPESFYQTEEPKPAPEKEQLKACKKDGVFVNFGNSANNTLHALIDALNKNTTEAAQLRKAIFGLLNASAGAD